MADVFLSYARDDKQRAAAIAKALEQQGYDVFWDNEIPPGATWADYLQSKIQGAKVQVVLWTATSVQSQWVREEARIGRDAKKLVPIVLDSAMPPFGFGEVQAVDLTAWRGDAEDAAWKRFLAGLASLVQQGGGSIGQPKPGPKSVSMPAGVASLPETQASTGASGGGKTPLYIGLGVAGLALIGAALFALQPRAPSGPAEPGVVTPSPQALSPAVTDAVERAQTAQRDARSAAVQARLHLETGKSAERAAEQGQSGFNVNRAADGGVTAGDLTALSEGRAAALGIKAADGSQFYGLMTVSAAGMLMNGQTTAGPIRMDGKLDANDSGASFVGIVAVTGRFTFEGVLRGAAANPDVQAGHGQITYSNGQIYDGEVQARGEGASMTFARQGIGRLRGADGATINAGRFADDAFTSPN